jgi:hypothetical protein
MAMKQRLDIQLPPAPMGALRIHNMADAGHLPEKLGHPPTIEQPQPPHL